jgi:hypothetical protein
MEGLKISKWRKSVRRNGKRVWLSRVIMEEKIGRVLDTNEWVHHKDGNPFNNKEDNLEIMLKLDHLKYHNMGRKESENPNEAWCSRCKQFLDKSKFTKSGYHWNGLDFYCGECRRKYWRERHEQKI